MNKRILEKSKIENIVKKFGWTNLRWGPGDDRVSPFLRRINRYHYVNENTGLILYGRPKNYEGIYSDYTEEIIVEIRNKERLLYY